MIPATQSEAWASIRSSLTVVQWRTWLWFAENPKSSRNELDHALGAGAVNAAFSRRIAELVRRGLLRECPARTCRISGYRATTYEAVVGEPKPVAQTITKAQALKAIEGVVAGVPTAAPSLFDDPARRALARVREIVEATKGAA